ncbi:hypothetical protein [uncultured Cohaesibacter sp.]|uniref:hypothetical protein n=1 Tax=uncultured Cohaesibacter sp. TaxID=1002546 RepID=UPI0029C669D7|nr:hypothetical protein [uncultured Cohaesibacter sp.]
MSTAKSIVADLGAKAVAARLGVGVTAVSNAVVAGSFPSAWWFELTAMGRERGLDVPVSLFRWRSVSSHTVADCVGSHHD